VARTANASAARTNKSVLQQLVRQLIIVSSWEFEVSRKSFAKEKLRLVLGLTLFLQTFLEGSRQEERVTKWRAHSNQTLEPNNSGQKRNANILTARGSKAIPQRLQFWLQL
jgi:hypothetical protein